MTDAYEPAHLSRFTRWGVRLVTVLTLAAGITACARAEPPTGITLVLTASSAEPRPALPDSLESDLTSLAKTAKKPGEAKLKIITAASGQATERDLTPLRGPDEVEHSSLADAKIRASVEDVEQLVANTKASAPGLDLLTLLDRTAESNQPGSVHVISSGLSTVDPIDWRVMGWLFDIDAALDSLDQRGLLPHLAGKSYTFHGLGLVAGSQPRLPPFARDQVQKFWLRFCQRAGANRCEVAPDAVSGAPSAATLPVPVVPVAAELTVGGCAQWMSLSDGTLHFAPDSALLSPAADTILRRIVSDLRRCNLAVDITGHVADAGPGDGLELSERRAQAVADRLAQLGAAPAALARIVGRGDAEPVVANWTLGRFDEAKAAWNRRVELEFHRSSSR